MQELVEYLVKAIVDAPEAVQVTAVDRGQAIIYEVSVDPEDLGRVIGRHGRTAEALRAIVKAAGKKYEQLSSVEILS